MTPLQRASGLQSSESTWAALMIDEGQAHDEQAPDDIQALPIADDPADVLVRGEVLRTHTHTYAHTRTQTYTCAHTRTQTYTCAHIRKHTYDTHIYTSTY